MSRFQYINKNNILTNGLHSEFNRSLETNVSPPTMKLVNLTPTNKKSNRSEKDNYPLVSILPNLSKIFERYISKQIAQFFGIKYSLNTNVISGKATVLNTA